MADVVNTAGQVIGQTDAPAKPSFPFKGYRVISTGARSPANEPVDIVEIELSLPNDGNCDWMRWMDHLRFQCEAGKADGLLKAMGLK